MPINDNHVDVARYRGPVRPCEFCKSSVLPPELRMHCKFCLTNGYVAQCLKCDGSGSIKSIGPWDNTSEHHSTCDICGGLGMLPTRKPEGVEPSIAAVAQPSTPSQPKKDVVKQEIKEVKENKESKEPVPAA